MTIIVCLDNSNGMMFNHRRQSKDANVIKDVCVMLEGRKLFIDPYSKSLFDGFGFNTVVSESFLTQAGDADYCFIEKNLVSEHRNRISKIVVYKWNRDYPSDFSFDIDYENEYQLESSVDFSGTSHEKITKEVYVR